MNIRVLSFSALTAMLLTTGDFASAQSTDYVHGDFKMQTLNPNGGSFYGDLINAYGYQVLFTYPAGGPAALTDISTSPLNALQPSGFTAVRLNLTFNLGVSKPGFVFKGTSTLKFSLPTSIADGTTMKLAFWSMNSSGTITYGSILSGVSSGHSVTFVVSNMTLPSFGDLGFTLGN